VCSWSAASLPKCPGPTASQARCGPVHNRRSGCLQLVLVGCRFEDARCVHPCEPSWRLSFSILDGEIDAMLPWGKRCSKAG
jgi:hypothetical protein